MSEKDTSNGLGRTQKVARTVILVCVAIGSLAALLTGAVSAWVVPQVTRSIVPVVIQDLSDSTEAIVHREVRASELRTLERLKDQSAVEEEVHADIHREMRRYETKAEAKAAHDSLGRLAPPGWRRR